MRDHPLQKVSSFSHTPAAPGWGPTPGRQALGLGRGPVGLMRALWEAWTLLLMNAGMWLLLHNEAPHRSEGLIEISADRDLSCETQKLFRSKVASQQGSDIPSTHTNSTSEVPLAACHQPQTKCPHQPFLPPLLPSRAGISPGRGESTHLGMEPVQP